MPQNVSEQQLRDYLEVFHDTLSNTAKLVLTEEQRPKVLHLSVLPARVTGFVSTQFGVAVDYEPAEEIEIEIIRGSRRVEDLFMEPSSRSKELPFFRVGNGAHVELVAGSVIGYRIRLEGDGSYLKLDDTKVSAGDEPRLVSFAELYGNRLADYWSTSAAISRAKDEILAAVVEARRAESKGIAIAKYISQFKARTVLLLGDYRPDGRARLEAIRQGLIRRDYEPVLIDEIPDNPHHDLAQKVAAIGAICRFVVVDDSSKSGHLMEIEICKQHDWVTLLLRHKAGRGSWMTQGASILSAVIKEEQYDDSTVDDVVGAAVQWAEKKLRELGTKFTATYPWRQGPAN